MLLLHGISPAEAPTVLRQAQDERNSAHGELVEPQAQDERLLRGLRDQALVRIESGTLVAHATCWQSQSRELEQQDLLAHHALIDQLHAGEGACLPARFPTWIEDEHSVQETLEKRSTEFHQALEKIRGRVELAITALSTAAPSDEAATPGTRCYA